MIEHAKAAFGLMGSNPATMLAKRLLVWMAENELREFTKRDAHRAIRVDRASQLDDPLGLLVERGYVRERPVDGHSGPGRAPSARYEVNPLWLGQNGHKGQNSAEGGIVSILSNVSGGLKMLDEALKRLRALRAGQPLDSETTKTADVATPDQLPVEWRVEWLERASIRQFDGGQGRETADREALREIIARIRAQEISQNGGYQP